MADSVEKEEMKGGHAPAQKVGGMRVVSHRRDSEKATDSPSKDDKKASADDKEEFGVDKPVKAPSVSWFSSYVIVLMYKVIVHYISML